MMQSKEYQTLLDDFSTIRNAPLEIVFCERFDESSDMWNFTLHNHEAIELIYFRSGKGAVNVGSEAVSISSYDVIAYPAGVFHREFLAASEHQEVICIHIKGVAGFRFESPVHIRDKDKSFRFLFNEIYRNFHSGDESCLNLATDYARILLLNCVKSRMDTYDNADYADTALCYIDDHFREPLTLDGLASLVHVSTAYLSRQFKERTGTTIIQYINRLRTEEACHMLRLSDYSVEEISRMTGFESPKYFSRVFKAHTGKTPSEYRAS